MPSSVVQTFSDPDDYAASIRGTRAEMTVIGRGHFDANSSGSSCIACGCNGFPTTCQVLRTRPP